MSILSVSNLGKAFGGVHAVRDLSFEVAEGIIYSVIGPNGAGKTSVFNLISGIYSPTSGQVFLGGRDVTAFEPQQRAALGLARTFQNLQIFYNLSALENVLVGLHLRLDLRLFPQLFRTPGLRRRERDAVAEARDLMRFVGLEAYLSANPSAMPFGALKRLEIARAIAAKPKVLLLDEPAAGLNQTETEEIDALIRRIGDSGATVLLVEHDMRLVMKISDRILVLDNGRKLGEGTPAEIRANPDVISAYLGAAALGPKAEETHVH